MSINLSKDLQFDRDCLTATKKIKREAQTLEKGGGVFIKGAEPTFESKNLINTNSDSIGSAVPAIESHTNDICHETNPDTISEHSAFRPHCARLNYSFYDVSCQELAQNLLGKILVRSLENGIILKGRIVETECYLGGEDKASHSYNGKVTPRNKPMYMRPGTTYVYFTYGMYFCFNISSKGDGAAVLVRSLDPLCEYEFMISQRQNKRMSMRKGRAAENPSSCKNPLPIKLHELCNGPGKLCISLCIDEKSCNMKDLCSWGGMWIESDAKSDLVCQDHIITSTRIGIDSAGTEWALKPLRFYIFGNPSVSKRDRNKEGVKLNTK